MKFLTDMHIHTVSSGHAYSTVDEIAREAAQKNLELIAITDHSSGMPGGPHDYHFYNLGVIPRQLYGVNVLRGVEANIINFDGHIDVTPDIIKSLDIVIASFHPPCISFADEKACTRGFIGAMENPDVTIIGHPGDSRYPFDHRAVVEAAKRTGTLLEVNNASLKPGGFRPGVRENLVEMLKYCNKMDVPVLANTDSHIAYQVGEFGETISFLELLQFPKELILNLDSKKVLNFIGLTD